MSRRRPPPTEEGWYAFHDFRQVDWGAWRSMSQPERERILEAGRELLASIEAEGAEGAGDSAFFVGLGHHADLIGIHFRETLGDLDAIERRIDASPLCEITTRSDSYISVTEVSGYLTEEYFEDDASVDPGIERYIQTRLYPSIPDAEVVSFYPMSKRRGDRDNWYDLSFEDRAEHMAAHGEIGKQYAGKVRQIITGSIGFEDWEWGVTLFADDPTVIKSLLYEMRFDPSTSRFGEFGPFRVGRRMAPTQLDALLAGEPVGTSQETGQSTSTDEPDATSIREELADLGVYAGQPHGEDINALVLYSTADQDELVEGVNRLVGNFDHYDTHVDTGVYETEGRHAIVSLWKTASAAETAAGFLTDLPSVQERDDGDGWETMGMFYTVKPEHRGDFVDTFDQVGAMLDDMEGHRETHLFTRVDDDCDMFIASRWDAKADAMGFFGSEAFRETVQWGRDVLQRRPRHVFLA